MTKAKQHTFIGTYKYTHITQLNKKQANKTEKLQSNSNSLSNCIMHKPLKLKKQYRLKLDLNYS